MTISQICLNAFGVFMATYINAQIFGELTVIMSSISQEEEEFERKKAFCEGAMIDLKLPFDLRQQVRKQIVMFEPLGSNQQQMSFLIGNVPPSLQFRIIQFSYSKYLN